MHGVKSTDTLVFIFKHEVPAHKKITYANFVCDIRHLKDEPYRVRLVVGGDKLPYNDDAGSPVASILETKLLINSVISGAKQGARFLSMDLKDFFLASPMPEPEFMKIHKRYIPDDIIAKYSLKQKFDNDYIYAGRHLSIRTPSQQLKTTWLHPDSTHRGTLEAQLQTN